MKFVRSVGGCSAWGCSKEMKGIALVTLFFFYLAINLWQMSSFCQNLITSVSHHRKDGLRTVIVEAKHCTTIHAHWYSTCLSYFIIPIKVYTLDSKIFTIQLYIMCLWLPQHMYLILPTGKKPADRAPYPLMCAADAAAQCFFKHVSIDLEQGAMGLTSAEVYSLHSC